MMQTTCLIILSLLLLISFFSFWRDKNLYQDFKLLSKTEERQKLMSKWVIEPFLLFGVLSIICLLIIGEFDALFTMPDFLMEISNSIRSMSDGGEEEFLPSFLKGIFSSIVPLLLIGTPIATLFGVYAQFANQKPGQSQPKKINDKRDINHLMPLNSKERKWAALLSINAGFSEELFFRLLAPILIFAVTGSAIIAIIGSTLWFGCAHYYQGLAGIVATAIIGLFLFFVYLLSQSIWITMLVHAILDLNGLVLGPWFKEYLEHRKK